MSQGSGSHCFHGYRSLAAPGGCFGADAVFDQPVAKIAVRFRFDGLFREAPFLFVSDGQGPINLFVQQPFGDEHLASADREKGRQRRGRPKPIVSSGREQPGRPSHQPANGPGGIAEFEPGGFGQLKPGKCAEGPRRPRNRPRNSRGRGREGGRGRFGCGFAAPGNIAVRSRP